MYSRNREADGCAGHKRQEHKNDLTDPSLESQASKVVECFIQHTVLTLFFEFGSQRWTFNDENGGGKTRNHS